MRHKIAGLVAFVSLFVGACSDTDASAYREDMFVFGTSVSVTIEGVPEAAARAAFKSVGLEMQVIHKAWHAWKPGELTDLNKALARGECFEVSPLVGTALAQAGEFFRLSDGRFNPAIGALVDAWGFHSDDLPIGSLPPLAMIKELAARAPSMDDVTIEGATVCSRNRAVQFDFGGFGKGAALDRMEKTLVNHGVAHAVLNAGGDINTLGRSASGEPRRIGIRDPVHWGAIASVDLEPDEKIYTSGNYERYRESEGIRYAHIIDPESGMPVDDIVSATVIAYNGALADAAATALTIAGPQGWYDLARSMGLKFVMLIDEHGTIYLSPEMMARVKFVKASDYTIALSEPLIGTLNEAAGG